MADSIPSENAETPSNGIELVFDLQREVNRLETQRSVAILKRDRVFDSAENGDDTGHSLIIALDDLKRIEARLEQVSQLLSKERQRVRSMLPNPDTQSKLSKYKR